MSTSDHKQYMKRCLSLAEKGAGHVSPNPLVGCVIVNNGTIIAEGYHHAFGEKHAEIDALDTVAGNAGGATLYVNLEPCSIHGKTPPCTDRIIQENIERVVVGCIDPHPNIAGRGIATLRNHGIEVIHPVLEEQSRRLNQWFFAWITEKKPYVTLKMACSKDNYIALPDGSPITLSSQESRHEVHALRSRYDAVLIGKTTALRDNPRLTVRHVTGRNPIRVVLDSHGTLNDYKHLHLMNDEYAHKTWWVVGRPPSFTPQHGKVLHVPLNKAGKIDINQLLATLAQNNISSLLVEGGRHIWDSFIAAGAADHIIVYTSPNKLKKGIPYSSISFLDTIQPKHTLQYRKGPDTVTNYYLRTY